MTSLKFQRFSSRAKARNEEREQSQEEHSKWGLQVCPDSVLFSSPGHHHLSHRKSLHMCQKHDSELSSNLSLFFLLPGIIFPLKLRPDSLLPFKHTSTSLLTSPHLKENQLPTCLFPLAVDNYCEISITWY